MFDTQLRYTTVYGSEGDIFMSLEVYGDEQLSYLKVTHSQMGALQVSDSNTVRQLAVVLQTMAELMDRQTKAPILTDSQ